MHSIIKSLSRRRFKNNFAVGSVFYYIISIFIQPSRIGDSSKTIPTTLQWQQKQNRSNSIAHTSMIFQIIFLIYILISSYKTGSVGAKNILK